MVDIVHEGFGFVHDGEGVEVEVIVHDEFTDGAFSACNSFADGGDVAESFINLLPRFVEFAADGVEVCQHFRPLCLVVEACGDVFDIGDGGADIFDDFFVFDTFEEVDSFVEGEFNFV